MGTEGRIPSKCLHCGKEFLAGGDYAGRKVRCPNKDCGEPVRIPAAPENAVRSFDPTRLPASKASHGTARLPWSIATFLALLLLAAIVMYFTERSAYKREADRWASADRELQTSLARNEQLNGQIASSEAKRIAVEAKSGSLETGKTAAENKIQDAAKELATERSTSNDLKLKSEVADKRVATLANDLKSAQNDVLRLEKELNVSRKDLVDSRAKVAAKDDVIAKMKKAQLAKVERTHFVGKWLMSDGVIEFKDDGTFVNVGDLHRWEFAGGELTLIFSGKREKREFELSGDRLTMIFDDGSRFGALRLGSKELSSAGKWTVENRIIRSDEFESFAVVGRTDHPVHLLHLDRVDITDRVNG